VTLADETSLLVMKFHQESFSSRNQAIEDNGQSPDRDVLDMDAAKVKTRVYDQPARDFGPDRVAAPRPLLWRFRDTAGG
jgi:hypothetical protein